MSVGFAELVSFDSRDGAVGFGEVQVVMNGVPLFVAQHAEHGDVDGREGVAHVGAVGNYGAEVDLLTVGALGEVVRKHVFHVHGSVGVTAGSFDAELRERGDKPLAEPFRIFGRRVGGGLNVARLIAVKLIGRHDIKIALGSIVVVAMLQKWERSMGHEPSTGPLLRQRRRDLGLTLASLGSQVGLSVSTLSRLENQLVQPNLSQLLALSRFFGCSIDELVHPVGARVSMAAITRDGVTFVPLARPADGLHVFKVSAPPQRAGDRRTACAHDGHLGHQWIYVLSGRLRVQLGSRRSYLLNPGESTQFDTRSDHLITSAGEDGVDMIMVFGPEGQRQRVVDLGYSWVHQTRKQ